MPFHEAAGRLVPPAGVESSAHDHGVIASQATDLAGGQQIDAEAFVTQPICHRLSQASVPPRAEPNVTRIRIARLLSALSCWAAARAGPGAKVTAQVPKVPIGPGPRRCLICPSRVLEEATRRRPGAASQEGIRVFRLATLTRPAVAALAAAAFAVTGCAAVTATGTPASAPPADSAGARSGPLITEPGAGFGAVYHLINQARHSVDVTMYELADSTAERDLAAAARRGVRVRVVLDEREDHTNSGAYSYLKSHGVEVTWSSASYRYTHQKTLIIDRSVAVIMTANLTSKYYPTTRDFLVVDASRPDVAAITRVFNADYAHRPVRPGDGRDLVWSPTDAQGKLLALINGATSSLRIYSEEMGDSHGRGRAHQRGQARRRVRVCGENTYGEYDSEFAKLARAGVRGQLLQRPRRFLHSRKGHRGRLRHPPREGVHRVGEFLQHVAQPQP